MNWSTILNSYSLPGPASTATIPLLTIARHSRIGTQGFFSHCSSKSERPQPLLCTCQTHSDSAGISIC